MRVSKPIPSSQQFNNEPVDITSDGDDGDNGNNGNNGDNDIISIDSLEYTEPLNSNCIENKTKKKRVIYSIFVIYFKFVTIYYTIKYIGLVYCLI